MYVLFPQIFYPWNCHSHNFNGESIKRKMFSSFDSHILLVRVLDNARDVFSQLCSYMHCLWTCMYINKHRCSQTNIHVCVKIHMHSYTLDSKHTYMHTWKKKNEFDHHTNVLWNRQFFHSYRSMQSDTFSRGNVPSYSFSMNRDMTQTSSGLLTCFMLSPL